MRTRALLAVVSALVLAGCGGEGGGGSEAQEPKEQGTSKGFTTFTVESSGFSIDLPESWETASGEKALEPEDIERVTRDNPNLKQFFEGLNDPTSPFKLVSIDPETEEGFSTNMNVVVTDLPDGVGTEQIEQASLSEIQKLNPQGEVEHEVIDHPAGEALRFDYDAEVNAGKDAVVLSFLQYTLQGDGTLHTLTFTTLPELETQYTETFERSAESYRLSG